MMNKQFEFQKQKIFGIEYIYIYMALPKAEQL